MRTHGSLLVDLSVRQLRAFVTVADSNSYAEAAERLHYTEPAVHAQIKRLEAMLGLRLFERSGRRVRLTAEGRALLSPCQAALAEIDRLDNAAQHVLRSRRIVIAAGPVTGSYLLPPLVRHFARGEPDILVELITAPASEILDLVATGAADVGVSGSLDQFQLPEGVSVRFWLDEPFSLHTGGEARQELSGTPVVYNMAQANGPLKRLRECLAERGIMRLETRFLSSADAVKGACAAGLGFALLPRRATILERRAGLLREVEGLAGAITGHVWVSESGAGERPPECERFVRFLYEAVDGLGAILAGGEPEAEPVVAGAGARRTP
ncbi:MAG TPA: LysR family transcriptional regulator [Dehalococcoidia bacterium]|nr:LysR family transcriptional regulator [Dehalococcoidia bacterium]